MSRHVVLKPEHLGDLHLDTHLATDISQQVVASSVNLVRLCHWTMVEPQDNIAVVAVVLELGSRNWDRLVGVVSKYS